MDAGKLLNPQPKASGASLERRALVALVVLLLASVLAHGLWRPLVHFLHSAGDAASVTGAALAVAAVILLLRQRQGRRAALLSFGGGVVAAGGAAAGLGLGLAGLVALICVAAAMARLAHWLTPQLPPALDGLAGRNKEIAALYVALALAAVVSTARLTVFVGDPARVDQQPLPDMEFLKTHSCLTAYVQAASLVRQGVGNVYDVKWWQGSEGQPPRDAQFANPYAPFSLDYYAYPPPFLFATLPLAPLDGDYPAQRALWFGLNAWLLALGLWVVARWVAGPAGHRTLLLAPLFFASVPVLVTLQVGNFQIAVVVIAVLAMVALQRDRPVLGGALLAFAILSKLSPGILGVVLLAQRRWRSAAWTAAWGVALLALSVAMFGTNPLLSFVQYAMPRISSGEAFAFMDDQPFSILTNMSPFGLAFKLQLLGVEVADPWLVGRQIIRVFNVILFVVALLAARRTAAPRQSAVGWMALLVLAALQSPFAPGYVVIGLLWALTLLAAEVRSVGGGVALVALGLLLTVVPPLAVVPLAAFTIAQSLVTIAVPLYLLLARRHAT